MPGNNKRSEGDHDRHRNRMANNRDEQRQPWTEQKEAWEQQDVKKSQVGRAVLKSRQKKDGYTTSKNDNSKRWINTNTHGKMV